MGRDRYYFSSRPFESYLDEHGPHFSKKLCEYAVGNMENADFFPEPLRNEFDIAMYVKKYIDDPDGYEGIAFSRYLADLKRTGTYIDWEEMI